MKARLDAENAREILNSFVRACLMKSRSLRLATARGMLGVALKSAKPIIARTHHPPPPIILHSLRAAGLSRDRARKLENGCLLFRAPVSPEFSRSRKNTRNPGAARVRVGGEWTGGSMEAN